ncbi:MAG: hypothetical protein IV097_11485 [Burkholderiaceae bacterium]|nr:hypothetical protein [Burkholderiaceae bacterium]
MTATSSAAVARALGAGRGDDASRLAQHALLIAVPLAALFMVALLAFGPRVYVATAVVGTYGTVALAGSMARLVIVVIGGWAR